MPNWRNLEGTTEYAEKALAAADALDIARRQAIEELVAAKEDSEPKLKRLGYGGARPRKDRDGSSAWYAGRRTTGRNPTRDSGRNDGKA